MVASGRHVNRNRLQVRSSRWFAVRRVAHGPYVRIFLERIRVISMRYSSTPFRFFDFAFMILSSHTPSAASLTTRSSILESVFACLFRRSLNHYQGKQSVKEPEGTVTFDSYIVPSIAQPFDSRTLRQVSRLFWMEGETKCDKL